MARRPIAPVTAGGVAERLMREMILAAVMKFVKGKGNPAVALRMIREVRAAQDGPRIVAP